MEDSDLDTFLMTGQENTASGGAKNDDEKTGQENTACGDTMNDGDKLRIYIELIKLLMETKNNEDKTKFLLSLIKDAHEGGDWKDLIFNEVAQLLLSNEKNFGTCVNRVTKLFRMCPKKVPYPKQVELVLGVITVGVEQYRCYRDNGNLDLPRAGKTVAKLGVKAALTEAARRVGPVVAGRIALGLGVASGPVGFAISIASFVVINYGVDWVMK